MKSIFVVFYMLVLAGCSSVTMKEPFIESQLTKKEQRQLAGTWQSDGQMVHVAFTSNGVPWLAGVDWKDDDFQLNKVRIHFTKRNDALYVSVPAEPNEGKGYLFAEIRPTFNSKGINVWGPNAAYFGELVESGKLKGSVEKDEHSTTVKLGTPAAEILELISTNPAAIDYKNPLLYRKLD